MAAHNILDEYLVRVGFAPDQSSFNKFQQTLKDAESGVERYTGGMLKLVLKSQIGIVGAFTSISAAILAMVDRVAMADQSYRLFGLQMMMQTESARKLKMITEGLGASLEQIIWDPELHERAVVMSDDIDRMSKALGPDFEEKMKGIRDLRFEFTRLSLAGQFLGMNFVAKLFEQFGVKDITTTLRTWVTSLEHDIPDAAKRMAEISAPILKQSWTLFKDIAKAAEGAGVAFTNIIGVLSGDKSLLGAGFSFEKIAKALEHIVGWMDKWVNLITSAETGIEKLVGRLGLSLDAGVGEKNPYKPGSADYSLWEMRQSLRGGVRSWFGESGETAQEKTPDEIKRAVGVAARLHNVDPNFLMAIAQQESKFNQSLVSPRGAIGVMQLMPDTAKELGVDPNNLLQNIEGGAIYSRRLLDMFGGNESKALAAYNAGPGRVARGGVLPAETQAYVPQVLARKRAFESQAGGNVSRTVSVGDINININQPHATVEQLKHIIVPAIKEQMEYQVQGDLVQPAY